MKRIKMWLTAVTVVLLVASASLAFAANPADTTSLFRYCPELYQYAYDGGPWHLFAIKPLEGNWSLMAYNWNSEDSNRRELEMALTKRFPEVGLQMAAIVDRWDGGSDNTKLMIDWTRGPMAIGTLVPISGDTPFKVGPRLTIGNVTTFATFAESGCEPTKVGASYIAKGAKLEAAYGGETWYLRASKRNGHVTTELRTRFTEIETFVGFSFTYYPY